MVRTARRLNLQPLNFSRSPKRPLPREMEASRHNRFFLSLSIGYAASDYAKDETLKSIISRADNAMYKEKRAKKHAAIA